MPVVLPRATVDELRLLVEPLTDGEAGDYDTLLKLVGEAQIVLLGTSSLGTHEFFRARAELTTRLIKDKGFVAVALPADSRAVQRLDSFVQGRSEDALAIGALGDVTSFPSWVWRNAEMLDFVGWLRNYKDHSRHVGDARATNQPAPSLGQLARERHGPRTVLVGFSTFSGTTIAAAGQGRPPRRQVLPPAPTDSVEALCRALEIPRFYLALRGIPQPLADALRTPLLERMVDAVFDQQFGAETYVRARLADQFDALIYFDETRSIEPLDVG
ncbi:MAG: erythromycin esterase family protein [Chloroflexi bacterium]|nr:MAG: erythromycin esterase family protein [Chloroflexota bacterium]